MFLNKIVFTNIFNKSLTLFNKTYVYQTLIPVKNTSTFHRWILAYFRTQPQYNKFLLKKPIKKHSFDYNPIQLHTISTDELLYLFSFKNVKSFHYEVDRELVCRINDMSINQIVCLMDACLFGQNKLYTNSISFKKCLEVMDELWFRRPDLTASQTLQLIFYASAYKIKSKSTIEFGLQKLMNEMNYLKQLPDEELSILALVTYKTSAKVYDKMLRIFAYRIEKNLSKLIQNSMHFVSLIKPLKKAKYHDPILFTKLINALKNNNNKVSQDLISSIHFLTYLADANCGDVTFLQQLIDSIGNLMVNYI